MIRLASANAGTTILGSGSQAGRYASALGAFEVGLAPVITGLLHMGHSRPPASSKIAIGAALGGLPVLLMVVPTSGMSATTSRRPHAHPYTSPLRLDSRGPLDPAHRRDVSVRACDAP